MARTPLVSVIVPAFNVGAYIGETIESALGQSIGDIEVIVVNDGSTDQTRDVVRKFRSRVVLIDQRNNGAASARNVALQNSRGRYLAFLDGDDTWLPENLELKLGAFQQAPNAGAAFGNFQIFDDKGVFEKDGIHRLYPIFQRFNTDILGLLKTQRKSGTSADQSSTVYEADAFHDLFLGNFILTSTLVVRRTIAERVGEFDVEFRTNQDYEYFLRLARTARLAYVDQATVMYRRRESQLTNRRNIVNVLRAVEKIIRRYEVEFIAENHAEEFRRRHSYVLSDLAKAELAIGNRAQSKSSFLYSIRSGRHSLDNYVGLALSILPQGVTEKLLARLNNNRD